MRDQLAPRPPVSPKLELKRRLQEALAKENYELAAILRDELRAMGE
jgi:protein-arginine kinase activator protein McsA